jgi:hypothetical protein
VYHPQLHSLPTTMKLLLLLTVLVGLAMALDFSELDTRQRRHRRHKKTSRPKRFSGATAMRAARRPSGAPTDYKTSTGRATHKRSKANLKKLPADLVDPDMKKRSESLHALRLLRRQATAADFYECGTVSLTQPPCLPSTPTTSVPRSNYPCPRVLGRQMRTARWSLTRC